LNKGISEELHVGIHPLFVDVREESVSPIQPRLQLSGQIRTLNLESMIHTSLGPQKSPVPLPVEKQPASTIICEKVLTEHLSMEFRIQGLLDEHPDDDPVLTVLFWRASGCYGSRPDLSR